MTTNMRFNNLNYVFQCKRRNTWIFIFALTALCFIYIITNRWHSSDEGFILNDAMTDSDSRNLNAVTREARLEKSIEEDEPSPMSMFQLNISMALRVESETSLLTVKNVCPKNVEYIFVIQSAVENVDQRNAIRQTWGLWIKRNISDSFRYPLLKGLPNRQDMKYIFFLGRKLNEKKLSSSLVEEFRVHQDIIVEDFVDSYNNLTIKSLFMLKWVERQCNTVKYVMKVDDDTFVNIHNLRIVLDSLSSYGVKPLLFGGLICEAYPFRDKTSKWFMPPSIYNEKYPNYVSGTFYIISKSIVKLLLNAALKRRYMHLEDLFVTGFCARDISVKPMGLPGVKYLGTASKHCTIANSISVHQISPSNFMKIWNDFQLLDECTTSFTPRQLTHC